MLGITKTAPMPHPHASIPIDMILFRLKRVTDNPIRNVILATILFGVDTLINRKYKTSLFEGREIIDFVCRRGVHREPGKREGRIRGMNIDLNGIVVVTGNYGSGKTEVSVNLALERRAKGIDVRLADLDLVNPYFRTREARHQLRRHGIEVILPREQYMAADLPILVREVAGALREQSGLVILDAGGDDAGATVLASLADRLRDLPVNMLQVVNPFRPFTESIAGCIAIKKQIEAASKMKMTGVVGNANLIDETLPEHIYDGYEFAAAFACECHLKLEFITAPDSLAAEVETGRMACPVLNIKRQLVPPWKAAAALT